MTWHCRHLHSITAFFEEFHNRPPTSLRSILVLFGSPCHSSSHAQLNPVLPSMEKCADQTDTHKNSPSHPTSLDNQVVAQSIAHSLGTVGSHDDGFELNPDLPMLESDLSFDFPEPGNPSFEDFSFSPAAQELVDSIDETMIDTDITSDECLISWSFLPLLSPVAKLRDSKVWKAVLPNLSLFTISCHYSLRYSTIIFTDVQ